MHWLNEERRWKRKAYWEFHKNNPRSGISRKTFWYVEQARKREPNAAAEGRRQ
jgi:hypothetical protein